MNARCGFNCFGYSEKTRTSHYFSSKVSHIVLVQIRPDRSKSSQIGANPVRWEQIRSDGTNPVSWEQIQSDGNKSNQIGSPP